MNLLLPEYPNTNSSINDYVAFKDYHYSFKNRFLPNNERVVQFPGSVIHFNKAFTPDMIVSGNLLDSINQTNNPKVEPVSSLTTSCTNQNYYVTGKTINNNVQTKSETDYLNYAKRENIL